MNKKCTVFIHGIGSSTQDAWGDLKEALTKKQNNNGSSEFSDIDFKYYDYKTSKVDSLEGLSKSVIKRLFKVKDATDSFFSQIDQLSKAFKTYLDGDEFSEYEYIYIVAHSMGGLISTRYLLDEFSHNKKIKINRILYICTPFLGSLFSDAAVKLGIASPEANDMTISSEFLKTLLADVKNIKPERKINSSYFFGDRDDIIQNYSEKIDYDNQKTLKGDHSSLLKGKNLIENLKEIENFLLEVKHQTLIDTLYANAASNSKLSFDNNYKRKVEHRESFRKLQKNHLETSLLRGNDKKLYLSMMKLINNHHFNPHLSYQGEKYYVDIDANEAILREYWNDINSKKRVIPFFYIGSRGSGKTLAQNIWLKRHYKEMEDSNIFHVRCDVHKIYHLMRNSAPNSNYRKLRIESYLDMQFIYIFFKYRDKDYNNKGRNNKGSTSYLMKRINNEINHSDLDIVKGSKFKNLGEFIRKQSENIKHKEVNIYPNDRTYSYAVDLMGNILSETNIIDIANDYDNLSYSILNNERYNKLDEFFGTIDEEEKSIAIDKILYKIHENKNYSREIQISDMNTTLLKINEDISVSKKNTTKLWIKISRHVQSLILSINYKILKIIDGIDNIIIQDSIEDKQFYEDKINEIEEIVNTNARESLYYFISLRHDTFSHIEEIDKKKTGYVSSGTGDIPFKYSTNIHTNAGESLERIIAKRYDAIEKPKLIPYNQSLYSSILSCVFKEYSNISMNKIQNINHIRIILRNYLFISLHVLFEFNRKRRTRFDKKYCLRIIEQRFNETFFLRNKLYIKTGEIISTTREDKYKVFPNIFYNKSPKRWQGLCRIRILQILKNNSLQRGEIISILNSLYPVKYINKKVDSVFSYNLISAKFDRESQTIKYKTTYKGKYLMNLVNKDLDILYYLCIDTPLPAKFVDQEDDFSDKSYLSVFNKSTSTYINTGYGNSIIKSVMTFILFTKYIHDIEMKNLRECEVSDKYIEKLCLPFDLPQLENNMKSIYRNVIENYDNLHSYFKHVGRFDDAELKAHLDSFRWYQ